MRNVTTHSTTTTTIQTSWLLAQRWQVSGRSSKGTATWYVGLEDSWCAIESVRCAKTPLKILSSIHDISKRTKRQVRGVKGAEFTLDYAREHGISKPILFDASEREALGEQEGVLERSRTCNGGCFPMAFRWLTNACPSKHNI